LEIIFVFVRGLVLGTVKLTHPRRTSGIVAVPSVSGCCHGVPRHERAGALKSLMAGAKPMSANGEQVPPTVRLGAARTVAGDFRAALASDRAGDFRFRRRREAASHPPAN